jgi:hypothetical protein
MGSVPIGAARLHIEETQIEERRILLLEDSATPDGQGANSIDTET